jgi:hypothetical protein
VDATGGFGDTTDKPRTFCHAGGRGRRLRSSGVDRSLRPLPERNGGIRLRGNPPARGLFALHEPGWHRAPQKPVAGIEIPQRSNLLPYRAVCGEAPLVASALEASNGQYLQTTPRKIGHARKGPRRTVVVCGSYSSDTLTGPSSWDGRHPAAALGRLGPASVGLLFWPSQWRPAHLR